MNELLARILAAHGGMNRWNGYEKVNATIVSGGGFFPLKGVPQDSNGRHWPCDRICRGSDPRFVDGRKDDRLQYVD
jgi:hypothetical protein